jgi:hypothetical protein
MMATGCHTISGIQVVGSLISIRYHVMLAAAQRASIDERSRKLGIRCPP